MAISPFVALLPYNPFPQDKILDQTKLKVFADDKLDVAKMVISVFDTVANIVRKQFLLFPQCFQKASFPDTSKGVVVWEWVKLSTTLITT